MGEQNRAFLLTGPGTAAIAVMRLKGPLTQPFLQRHFSKPVAPGRCIHGTLRDGNRIIDDPVVVLLPQQRGADISLHGGAWVVKSALTLARDHGFAVAEPTSIPLPEGATEGQTPMEREVLAHLPLARTELAVRVLLGQ